MQELRAQCASCYGLCCIALYCFKSDGFPADKAAGEPCKYLQSSFRCGVYATLKEKHLKGCLGYDCFGAGQETASRYPARSFDTACQEEILHAFSVIFQLYIMRWYLWQSLTFLPDKIRAIMALIEDNISLSKHLYTAQLPQHKQSVNSLLKEVIGKLCRGNADKGAVASKDLSMKLLIGVDMAQKSFYHTALLGSDMRDMNIKGADLRHAIFLTQMQVNSAIGNDETKLPTELQRPTHWEEV